MELCLIINQPQIEQLQNENLDFAFSYLALVPPPHVEVARLPHHLLRKQRCSWLLLGLLRQRGQVAAHRGRLQSRVRRYLPVRPLQEVICGKNSTFIETL